MASLFTAPPSHLANLRDLASASPGIVPGKVLRSDHPLARDEAPQNLAWPPHTVVDLRDASEVRGEHPLAGDAQVHVRPLLAQASLAAVRDGEKITLPELYARMLTGEAAVTLTSVVDVVAMDEAPVLVHCSAGKDRTGVVVALVLSLVGVHRDLIVEDYVRTAPNVEAVMSRLALHMPWPRRMLSQYGFARAFAERDRLRAGQAPGRSPAITQAAIMMDAPASAIESVLDTWDAYPGGVQAWYLAHGGSVETLARLRERLQD